VRTLALFGDSGSVGTKRESRARVSTSFFLRRLGDSRLHSGRLTERKFSPISVRAFEIDVKTSGWLVRKILDDGLVAGLTIGPADCFDNRLDSSLASSTAFADFVAFLALTAPTFLLGRRCGQKDRVAVEATMVARL
jgi:hypothetical protein